MFARKKNYPTFRSKKRMEIERITEKKHPRSPEQTPDQLRLTRRTVVFKGLAVTSFAALTGRLWQLQVRDHQVSVARNPNWWTAEHDSRWDKVKTAFARDWEQTKHDFGSKAAPNLDQSAGDTVKQAAASTGTHDFTSHESAFRYGHGAQTQYKNAAWDDSLEARMRDEYPGDWGTDRDYVRHGYSHKS